MKRVAAAILGGIAMVAILAPVVAPHAPATRFPDHQHAPPTRLRVVHEGRLRAPFFYPQRLTNRLEERFEQDRAQPIVVQWFAGGRLLVEPAGAPPLLLAGADRVGRDVFARALYGARVSLGIGALAVAGAALLGLLVGGLAGARGGWVESAVMRAADLAAVLPAIYVVVALRAALPLVLPASTIIVLVIAILAVVGTPWVARGVRAIVAAERESAYAEAARAAGASPWRVLTRHLLPATRGYVVTQATLLFPAVVVAEATLSFVGLGLPDTVPSWGTALQETANVSALAAFPWILLPALGVFVVTWCVNTLTGERGHSARA
jgi:peptide/nickel transport system permease protein